jgi:serine/threonine protein kinase
VKLIDFGLACKYDPEKGMNGYAGTRTYMSPEMLVENYGSKSDMWSIGILFYVMITGCIPYAELEKEALNKQIIHGKIDEIPL